MGHAVARANALPTRGSSTAALGPIRRVPRPGQPARRQRNLSYRCRSVGSSLSRSQSPKKLVAKTVRKMATPGKKETHQAVAM